MLIKLDLHRIRSGPIPLGLVVVCTLLVGCAPGRDSDLDDRLAAADSLVAAWVGAERIPGAVLLVSVDGRVALERAYGSAQLYGYGAGQYPSAAAVGGGVEPARGLERLSEPRPMTTGTLLDLASVTKVMATTMAVMILVDRGRLHIDEPVRTYLPDFTGGGREAIAVRDLLVHRSGLAQWQPVYYHAADPDEAYAYIRQLPLAWPPGAERHYSDLGFMVLGRIVERVSGASFADFLREDLYEPLGLRHTGFRPGPQSIDAAAEVSLAATSHGNPFERRMVHDRDFGYRIDGNAHAWDGWRRRTLQGEVNDGNASHAFGGVAGHAGLFSTAGDLAVMLELLLERGSHAGDRLIAPDVVDLFLTPTTDAGQALGWQVPSDAPPGSFTHTGFTGTYVFGAPDRHLGIVLLTNRQNLGVDSVTSYPDVGPLQREVTAVLTACC
jgi:CubicO group peptidase (beta-lactamase class C family)